MSRLKTSAAVAAALAAAALAAAALVPAASAGNPPPPPPAERLLASGVLPLVGWLHAAPPAAAGTVAPVPVTAPLPPSQCQTQFGTACYDAALLRHIYRIDALPPGIDGRGVTVALILPFHNPVLRQDLAVFAAQAGLPAPDLHLITIGHPVTADPGNFEQAAAQEEGELDAEMILAVAPRVRLDYVETQVDTAASPASFSAATTIVAQLAALQPPVAAVSFSYGWYEENYAEAAGGSQALAATMIRVQDAEVDAAVRHGITVISADGDTGPTGPDLAGTGLYPNPTVAALADDPLVTAVSGTQVTANDSGVRTAPDVVWSSGAGTGGATGGGLSAVYARPAYQDSYAAIVGDHRGVGDIAMDASGASRVWIYTSRYQLLPGQASGWVRIAGTSVAAPLFTGIVALADQEAGHRLGAINPRLYALAGDPAANGIHPVTSGCNTAFGVPGYCAAPGPYSLPDGIGTVGDAALFVPALAGLTSGDR